MAYFIKTFDNKYNHYKYHYLDHITAVIDIRDNFWVFAIDLYSINNFSLPINSLAGDLKLPYQQVNNIAFNLASDQTLAKNVEHNQDYAKLYSGNFSIDISQNELFKFDLNNIKIDLNLSLFIDPEAAKGAGTDVKQEDLDKLIVETEEQRWDFHLYYTNTHLIQQSENVNNITGFSLPFEHECIPSITPVNIQCDNLSNIDKSFNHLVNISSNSPFQVLSAKVKFYYWIELNTEQQTIEKTLDISHQWMSNETIDLNDFTWFDYENEQIVFDPIGVPGFYIPKISHGFYELELQIMQKTAVNKFFIKNSFNFIDEIKQPIIQIAHHFIQQIDYETWKVVKNYD